MKKIFRDRLHKIELDGQVYDMIYSMADNKKTKEYEDVFNFLFICYHTKYKWIIENNKLYLTDAYYSPSRVNKIKQIFKTDKLFANWQNGDMKIVLKEEILYCNIVNGRDNYVRMDLRVLKFKEGILVSSHDTVEEHIQVTVKNYLEE